MNRTAARTAGAAIALLATLATAVPATATTPRTAAVPDAAAIMAAMDRQDGIRMTFKQDEGPDATVSDGLCSELAAGGCERGFISKDASLLVFGSARQADDYAGHADDDATALGRMVLSFGSPARVGEVRQDAYVDAVRTYRRIHPRAKNSLKAVSQAVYRSGLPLRNAHRDHGVTRPGLAATFGGGGLVVDWAASKQADVMVFATLNDAQGYAGCGDDQVVRRGRVVLSFGNPALLGERRQRAYGAAFRTAMDRLTTQTPAMAGTGCGP